MKNTPATHTYRRLRRDDPYMRAATAWAVAKSHHKTVDESGLPDDVSFVVERTPDGTGPHGQFTSHPCVDSIDRVDLGWTESRFEHRYWAPESGVTLETMTDDLVKFSKMRRTDARERAIASLARECEQDANGYDLVVVTVTDEHGLVGEASICGIDDDFPTDAVVNEYDLLTEALVELQAERDRIIALGHVLESTQ